MVTQRKETMHNPKVSIVILNWNGLEDTIECLESLQKITYPNYDVIAVDNGSEGNDAEILREKFGKYIRLIRNDKNYGFAEGNNIGVRYALENVSPDYILLLNNDTVVKPGFLTELVKVARSDPKIGIVGGKIYLYGTNMLDSAGSLFNNVAICTSRGNLEEDRGQYDAQEEVPMITACCCLIRKAVLEQTYLFDPDFFLYYEEFDLNIRVRELGYNVVYVPDSMIYHKYSQSVKSETARQTLLVKQFYGNINRARILIKYYPTKTLLRNLFLILSSYLYFEYYFLRRGGMSWFAKFNYYFIKSLPPAFKERRQQRPEPNPGWFAWMDCYGFIDYLRLMRASGKQWEKRLRRLHRD
jgi:GT2 family glycosyltransferase